METLKRLDWPLIGAVAFLITAGSVVFASSAEELLGRQLTWLAIGSACAIGLTLLNLKSLIGYRWVILGVYGGGVLLLLATQLFGTVINNSKSWILIGNYQIQPSEFMKAALIILFASFFARRHIGIARMSHLLISFIYFAIPAALVFLEPDLGTTILLFGIWFSFLLVSEIPWRYLLIGLVILILVSTVYWNVGLADYQKERVRGLFNPEYDPLGINYSVIQSKIAIGSAGFLGKGFEQGTQLQLGFLPAAQTDFVFASFVEEWGILGGMLVILAFLLIIIRIVRIGMRSDNNFSRLFCLGSAALFTLQCTVNLGSTLGFLPVIGVSFPFLSYGGSNLLTNLALVGIIQNIAVRADV
ncbi:MAG: hypothetical protein A3H06_01515 [Candidatus Colwellbacteria bacterium RIFCSPLOWO2_12_FULL_44_13]|uniref:Rod shape-determining protein RodA n=2 Tax=Candidatus Colwelliibacteriota TaxID=1817904 RepID=A0A1G1Z346_9BACT|nr:MAG: hypothetical protein A3F24_01055 [Candidatus Colwellbacteria bacterium RIFCSPHIGHO2_12_FULL_44_17]OGY61630.1 MAG: hypothetical protein A3H06_01515 [Candidatus Colwellbacteria bacterium RIFCSPLOWO2_12_FULL_44_13]